MNWPSGEMSSVPTPARTWTSSDSDAVRFVEAPLSRNFTQTSDGPRTSDRYAIHLPSGEMAAPDSFAGVSVTRTGRDSVGTALAREGAAIQTRRAATAAAAS